MSNTASPGAAARDRALAVLLTCHDGQRLSHDLLDEMQRAEPLGDTDAALAAELVLGVLRHRLTAEHLAARCYRGRWAGLPIGMRLLLALAVYQLCWLERVPDHAAVDQAVRRAHRHGRHAAATVNAILRKVAAERGHLTNCPDLADPRRWLPVEPGRGRMFSENVFPDPAKRPLDHLIAVTSHPAWLVERWHRRFKPTLCRQVCDAGQRRPPLVLRPNRLRTTLAELLDRLQRGGHEPTRVADGDAILLRRHAALADLPEMAEGLCQPQDSTAQSVVTAAAPQPGEFVLDLCAGVGTKSTHAAEWMGNRGLVLATDADDWRLERIAPAAARLGVSIIETAPLAQVESRLTEMGRRPDVILVDAPCTNTGVLARRPEARYRASQKALAGLAAVQREILVRAEALAGPRTRIAYSTCSLEAEENEEQVRWFCTTDRGGGDSPGGPWRVARQAFTLPDADRDGGFVAVLARAAELPDSCGR